MVDSRETSETGGTGERVRGPKFEVFGTSTPEIRTSAHEWDNVPAHLARPAFPARRALLLIIYAHETESMRRGSLACCRPVLGLQDFCETVRSSFAQPHFDQRSNHGAHHVF